jgi:hypothetical protein
MALMLCSQAATEGPLRVSHVRKLHFIRVFPSLSYKNPRISSLVPRCISNSSHRVLFEVRGKVTFSVLIFTARVRSLHHRLELI